MTLNGSRDWRLLHIAGTVKLLLSPGKAGGLPKRNYFPHHLKNGVGNGNRTFGHEVNSRNKGKS